MTEVYLNSLSIEEVLHEIDTNGLTRFIQRAEGAGTTFYIGVDKIEQSERVLDPFYHISINGGILSTVDLALYPTALTGPAIAPTTTLPRSEGDHHSNLVFYVSFEKFTKFFEEAEEIFTSYYYQGSCFRLLPDIWFPEMTLIQFIREKILYHPVLFQLIEARRFLYKNYYTPKRVF